MQIDEALCTEKNRLKPIYVVVEYARADTVKNWFKAEMETLGKNLKTY